MLKDGSLSTKLFTTYLDEHKVPLLMSGAETSAKMDKLRPQTHLLIHELLSS
jgi:hypothetical protein